MTRATRATFGTPEHEKTIEAARQWVLTARDAGVITAETMGKIEALLDHELAASGSYQRLRRVIVDFVPPEVLPAVLDELDAAFGRERATGAA